MKLSKLILIAICAFALTFAACGGASTETSKTNTTNAGNTATTTQTKTETATKTAAVKQSTPSEAGESFINAVKAKDKTAFRQLMSKDSMEILNLAAREKKMTVDDLLDKEFFVNAEMPAKLEQRNEKITGDKATIEMQDDKGEWSPMTFVKEG
ncbi:MAG TPA: hypothetical protein VGB68_20485, partial [Pyrinomonadaceae bacterium]